MADYPLQGDFLAKQKNHAMAKCSCGKQIVRTIAPRRGVKAAWGPVEAPYEVCKDNHWHRPMAAAAFGWKKSMLAHCLIHAAFVQFLTGSWMMAVAEFVIHWTTDYAKCDGRISSNTDQAIHYGCKILWWGLMVMGGQLR